MAIEFSEYSGINEDHYGANYMYDIIQVIVKAFESSKDKQGAISFIKGIKKYDGKTGEIKQIKDKFFSASSSLATIKDGKLVIIED